jgi:hypothetical protein
VVAARYAFFFSLLLAGAASFASAQEKPRWTGGVQGGYNLGQNGQGWPQPWKDPLQNNNRGGFYIRQMRAQGDFPFDSTFSARLVANVIFADVQEAFIRKEWGPWAVVAGKFRGAGLKSGGGTDDFEMATVNHPVYANFWAFNKQSMAFRDFGVQGERSFFGGRWENKLWFHNANGENVLNGEPSGPAGKATQALGIDYETGVRVSPFSVVGGHIGARADREWGEFVGPEDFWRADYWFKTNALVDGSVYHQMDYPRFHLLTEVMALENRRVTARDSSYLRTWGASAFARYDWTRFSPFFRYEFIDPTNGYNLDDNMHVVTVGTLFRPAPEAYPGLRITGEYVRTFEEDLKNVFPNDILYVQMQLVL